MDSSISQQRADAITGKDLQTVAAGAAIGGAVEAGLYLAADIATGGLLTLGGLVIGFLIAVSDAERSK